MIIYNQGIEVKDNTGKRLLDLDPIDIHILRQLPEETRREVNKNVQDYIKQTGKDYHVPPDAAG